MVTATTGQLLGGSSSSVPAPFLAARLPQRTYVDDPHTRPPRPESSIHLPPLHPYHRSSAFTRGFLAGVACYEDTSLDKVTRDAQQRKELVSKRRQQVEQRQKALKSLETLTEKKTRRLEELRKKIRDERRERFELILRAVLRLQSVYRRRRLAEEKARQEKRDRLDHAVKRVQQWVRNRLAMKVATTALLDLREEVARRRAEKTIGHFLLGTRRIHEAKKYTSDLRQQRMAMVVMMELQAKEKVARFLQARYRGRRARVRVKKLKDKLVRMARDEERRNGRMQMQDILSSTGNRKRMKRTNRRRSRAPV